MSNNTLQLTYKYLVQVQTPTYFVLMNLANDRNSEPIIQVLKQINKTLEINEIKHDEILQSHSQIYRRQLKLIVLFAGTLTLFFIIVAIYIRVVLLSFREDEAKNKLADHKREAIIMTTEKFEAMNDWISKAIIDDTVFMYFTKNDTGLAISCINNQQKQPNNRESKSIKPNAIKVVYGDSIFRSAISANENIRRYYIEFEKLKALHQHQLIDDSTAYEIFYMFRNYGRSFHFIDIERKKFDSVAIPGRCQCGRVWDGYEYFMRKVFKEKIKIQGPNHNSQY